MVVFSILWLPLLKGSHGSEIFTYAVQVGSFFQPPIIGAFTLALLTSRVNEKVFTAQRIYPFFEHCKQ